MDVHTVHTVMMQKTVMREGITTEDRAGWLPVNRALSLRQQEEEQELEQQKQAGMMDTIIQRQQAMEQRLNTFIKAQQQSQSDNQTVMQQALQFQMQLEEKLGIATEKYKPTST